MVLELTPKDTLSHSYAEFNLPTIAYKCQKTEQTFIINFLGHKLCAFLRPFAGVKDKTCKG